MNLKDYFEFSNLQFRVKLITDQLSKFSTDKAEIDTTRWIDTSLKKFRSSFNRISFFQGFVSEGP